MIFSRLNIQKNNQSQRRQRTMQDGTLLIMVLVFGAIAITLLSGLVGWAGGSLRLARAAVNREQAFQIAEAGNEYYRWHLAHAPADYQDGTASPGPYQHLFYNKDGDQIGQFTLAITAPPIGSTIITITSTASTTLAEKVSRVLETKLAIPSLAQYAVVANDNMRFGEGTETFGPIQANGGIRFDGLAHNLVSSSRSTYTDPDTGQLEFGVNTQLSPADPTPPASVPSRPDVFLAGRQFPVGAVDFSGLTSNLSQMKTSAQSATGRYFPNSGFLGYHVVLKTNGTFDLYQVKTLVATPSGCAVVQDGWGTWSIKSGGETFVANYAYPTNGIIFLEDNVWVDGQVNGARLTIAAGTFPDNVSTRRSITVNNNLLYTNFDGTDSIALIAQNNINTGMVSADVLTIDAALIAQNGRVGRYYYGSNCAPYDDRTSLTLFGMIATNLRYGFAYTDNTGYTIRNINYDGNMLYMPPPSFPLTTSQYQTISWKQIR